MRSEVALRLPAWRLSAATRALRLVLLLTAASAPAGAVVKTYSAAPALVVPDNSVRTTTIQVPDFGVISDLDVTGVTLKFPNMADMTLRLIDPSNTVSVELMRGKFGVGDGILACSFNDEGGSPLPGFLVNGSCPSNTTYTPGEALSAFDGLQVHGIWTLEVSDSNPSDAPDCDCDGFNVGPPCPRTLNNWSLVISFTPDPTCTAVAITTPVIDTTRTYQGCGTTTVGPGVSLVSPANIGFFAGASVAFANNFSAGPNVSMRAGTCDRDLCVTGPPKDPNCMPCVGDICSVDPFCCGADIAPSWDPICVLEVESICRLDCP